MDDLKALMESQPIAQINQVVNQFIHAADGYDNKLKLTFVLLNLLHEGAQLLQTTDSNEFISEVRKRINELDQQSNSLADVYHMQLFQNNEIMELLSDPNSNRIADIQNQIDSLLTEYDNLIKALVELRDNLPIEKQLEKERDKP